MWTMNFWKELIFQPTFWVGIIGGGIAILALFFAGFIYTKRRSKKREKRENRQVEFTLPESRNT